MLLAFGSTYLCK